MVSKIVAAIVIITAGLCMGSPRIGVVVTGTTIGPGFVRREAESGTNYDGLFWPADSAAFSAAMTQCPVEHPFPCQNGTKCSEGYIKPTGQNHSSGQGKYE